MTTNRIPAIVLGGTGYVSGELLRLIFGHPNFALAGVMSDSSPGELAGKSFPHLAGALGDTAFKSQARHRRAGRRKSRTSAVFCAAPHGAAAALIDTLLKAAEAAGTKPRFVDISADFRSPRPPPTRRSTSIRTARRSASRSSPARCRST